MGGRLKGRCVMAIEESELRSVLGEYVQRHPSERESLAPLLDHSEGLARLTSSTHFDGGHLTCGALVVNAARQILVIRHRRYRLWLLPGGHIEQSDESLLATALRELFEETGITAAEVAPSAHLGTRPLDVELHPIPARADQPAHWHADVVFLFVADHPVVRPDTSEVLSYSWYDLKSAPIGRRAHKAGAALRVTATDGSSEVVAQPFPNETPPAMSRA
ncbi:NUDIX hydrolase [Micromonospora sp. CA-249363]|uniref:NUDIX hydrolase n=1 Tax=Micromonospora sp. CA-249363 TaxID=3239963 RepID=UPI003D8A60C3